jgi:hypothetical protein
MADPFIAPQDLVDYLGRGTITDPGMLIATDAACDICRDIAGQTFNLETSTVTLDGTGTDALLLPELPVTAAGTVTVAGSAVTDFVLNGNGILFRKTSGTDVDYTNACRTLIWPEGRQNITVTYQHGYADADLPRSVRMVALAIASRLVVQGVAVEESNGPVSVKYANAATDLTAGELRILQRYRQTRSS